MKKSILTLGSLVAVAAPVAAVVACGADDVETATETRKFNTMEKTWIGANPIVGIQDKEYKITTIQPYDAGSTIIQHALSLIKIKEAKKMIEDADSEYVVQLEKVESTGNISVQGIYAKDAFLTNLSTLIQQFETDIDNATTTEATINADVMAWSTDQNNAQALQDNGITAPLTLGANEKVGILKLGNLPSENTPDDEKKIWKETLNLAITKFNNEHVKYVALYGVREDDAASTNTVESVDSIYSLEKLTEFVSQI